jgi:hypothetical protein
MQRQHKSIVRSSSRPKLRLQFDLASDDKSGWQCRLTQR